MGFLRRVFGSHQQALAAAPDSRRADTLLAALDIDADASVFSHVGFCKFFSQRLNCGRTG